MKKYSYSINQFRWVVESNAFYAAVNDLTCIMNDGSIHPHPFPNNKSQFYIYNKKTSGFRRFRFTTERIYAIDYNNERYMMELIFESEDNIKCYIQQ
jgi:hypothetical protein